MSAVPLCRVGSTESEFEIVIFSTGSSVLFGAVKEIVCLSISANLIVFCSFLSWFIGALFSANGCSSEKSLINQKPPNKIPTRLAAIAIPDFQLRNEPAAIVPVNILILVSIFFVMK